ncbi:MAG: AMP-binding protein, partial [Oscillospiraceae bacterium]|nr:AMP-binding protein [Oscillospiraceae bacterium]
MNKGVQAMLCSTIREILVQSEKEFGSDDAIRYKIKKDVIEAKTYTQLKNDSESFSNVLKALGEQGGHISLLGMTSYEWIASYFGIVNSGSIAVPLDVSLPALEICELINRADVTVLVIDEIRRDVEEIAKQQCPNLKHIISIQKKESDEQALSFWQLLNDNSGEFDYTPNPEDLCTIMFTSGTTGKSKGVMLTKRNLA